MTCAPCKEELCLSRYIHPLLTSREQTNKPITELSSYQNRTKIDQIPIELLLDFAKHLPIKCYLKFRRISKYFQLMDTIQSRTFTAFKYSQLEFNESRLVDHYRMKLHLDDLDDESFQFLCENEFAIEFGRCLQSHKAHQISDHAKLHFILMLTHLDADGQTKPYYTVLRMQIIPT